MARDASSLLLRSHPPMKVLSEARFQGLIKWDLELAGAMVFNVHGGAVGGISYQGSGWPDLFVFHPRLVGGCAALELKIQGGAHRQNQEIKVRKLQDRRFRAFFLRLWRDGDLSFEVLRHADEKMRQILLVKGWMGSASERSKSERRERGHVLIRAIEEAWEAEFGISDSNSSCDDQYR